MCQFCFGSGMEVVPGKGARPCRCRREVWLKETVEKRVPFIYREARLQDLVARPDRHWKQEIAIAHIKAHPFEKYYLWGDHGSGKTHILWAIFRYALEAGRPVWGGNVEELLADYQKEIEGSKRGFHHRAALRPEDLIRRGEMPRWTLCFDELDKPNPNRWTASKFYEIVDAAYRNGHQIVCATNFSEDELMEKWETEGGQYGRSIVRRLLEDAFEVHFPPSEHKRPQL